MKQPRRLLNECNVELIASVKHSTIHLTSGGRSDVLGPRSCSAVNIVNEWELQTLLVTKLRIEGSTYESITRHDHVLELRQPRLSLFR